MSDSEASTVECAPNEGVSSLRSRFEKLSTENIVPPSSSLKPPSRPSSTYLDPSSGRPRALSNYHQRNSSSDSQHLRTSSSSSDLRQSIKRPPPPPPPRTPSPSMSPALHAASNSTATAVPTILEPSPQSSSRSSLLNRKPPPPPPGKSADGTMNGQGVDHADGEGIARPYSLFEGRRPSRLVPSDLRARIHGYLDQASFCRG
ncbi:hypothetical protein OE88DRAFT_1655468 [Heliocybe sulcata]|uniref:Uncharacterized protein n=1 Tax=Heliocybe sulcata TaxID=5364 RepID=A0A5C3N8C2_9AGAM|nr:hypothetical protein OE88DRAFT_1655468 [Heliocybe sulcata]